jgi:AcrR family transcriptional regulator
VARPKHDPDAEPTAERILAAAEAAFADSDYAAVKLADVAREVGIRRPSLLYHFGSKEQLYAAVVRRTFARLREALREAVELEGDFAARLDALVRGYLGFLEACPAFAPLLLRELLDGRGPGRELIERELVPVLDWLEAAVTEAGAGQARPGLPWRQALLMLAASPLVRAASGPLRGPLWGEGDHHAQLARILAINGDPGS